ncbi:MAG TPA: response regulator [Polyangiaceae bacterium]|jgi:DNA-binding response OmpR family regulator|nr:response regulator [Polyangiaceae bacterium]
MLPVVLIVDDSLTVRMDLSDAFESAGFLPILAATAPEARLALANEPVAAVILDVILPDEDGIELLREIRASESSEAPFVLLLSTEADVRDRIRGIQFGADDYVGKPYDTGYVIARVRGLLRSRRPLDNGAKQTILVIDDSVTFRSELAAALELANYTVVTAASGEEGLRIADSLRPTAILVDSVMPGIDGGTVIRRIRLDAALRATPCVLLTASEDKGAELRALDAGADAFVRKEDLEVVLARVAAVLRGTSLEPAQAASLLGPKRILAVDDSATYLNELLAVLRGEGYDVVPARSGEEGIEMLSNQQFDCILLDLVMPGIDGIETCRLIKASPLHRDIPLIMLTAAENRQAMIEALASGADDFISKSSELEVLRARVRAQLRRKQFEDEHRSVREKLLRSEIEAAEARAARELAETRARLVEALEQKNLELTQAYRDLQSAQSQLIQSAKLASLGELVAGVAHEINNPLAFVISHLGTVRRSAAKVDAAVRSALSYDLLVTWQRAMDRLAEMDGGLSRMRDLVLKLRTFSRLDEGERKVVSIRECIESLLTILGHRFKDRIDVQTRYADVDMLECYPSLLTQAVMNLVANAIDAIPKLGVITITTEVEDDVYRISVTDTGTGIPPEVLDRILDPFFTTKPVGQGTGLGLSITYSIVRKHGGTLEFLRAEGGGTEATIRIPLRLSAHDASA